MARALNKPSVWLKGEVKTPPFRAEARVEAGLLLRRLQKDALQLTSNVASGGERKRK